MLQSLEHLPWSGKTVRLLLLSEKRELCALTHDVEVNLAVYHLEGPWGLYEPAPELATGPIPGRQLKLGSHENGVRVDRPGPEAHVGCVLP